MQSFWLVFPFLLFERYSACSLLRPDTDALKMFRLFEHVIIGQILGRSRRWNGCSSNRGKAEGIQYWFGTYCTFFELSRTVTDKHIQLVFSPHSRRKGTVPLVGIGKPWVCLRTCGAENETIKNKRSPNPRWALTANSHGCRQNDHHNACTIT